MSERHIDNDKESIAVERLGAKKTPLKALTIQLSWGLRHL